MNKPNSFLIGGPKCGTSAIAVHLGLHKNIFVPDPKEPNFFLDDFPKMKFTDNYNEYVKLYDNVSFEETVVFDASVLYAFSTQAIENIYKFNKNAKLIMVLRDPMKMIPSYHKQMLFTMDENEKDFYKALKMEEDRRLGKGVPLTCRDNKLLYYSDIAKYAQQLATIYKFFPTESIKVILFDDFEKSNLDIYKQILKFFNLEYDGRVDFPKVNEAKIPSSSLINSLAQRPPKSLVVLVKILRKLLNKQKLGMAKTISHLNKKYEKVAPLPIKSREMLKNHYHDDVKCLSDLIGRDLGHWLNVKSE